MKHSSTKILLWLTPIFFIIITILFYCHWKSINKNITEIKEQNKGYYEKLAEKKNYGPFQIDYKSLNKKQVVIDPVEIEKINNHIKVLTEEVQKETNRAESIIDKDLDRLNLYMAVGIGFMTLLGIFAPVLFNVLSTQDLKDKQSKIQDDLKALSTKTDLVEKKAKENLPDVCNLILQNTILRFFSVSTFVLTEAQRKDDFTEFIEILKSIKGGFERCKDEEEHNIDNNLSFKLIIKDFTRHLNSDRFKGHPVFSSRKDYDVFDALILELLKLYKSKDEDKEGNYVNVIGQIQEVINQFNSKNVKNQPTTQTS